ncbi:MAG TPA: branched-chain amino acid transaminase [Planctomycetota bacterium]|nr:branched-chain amino acid transaminase [Planctomycetota bacterium]
MAQTQSGMQDAARYIWMDGERVPWRDANVHVMTHSLHYGIAVFEGIRCYATPRGPAIFRLEEHMTRLWRSAKICGMEIPYSRAELARACIDLVRANEQQECYIRPIVFFGAGKFGLNNIGAPVKVAVATWKWGAYLGDEGIRDGIRARVSSFTRIHVNAMMSKAKNSGNYANSQMARVEAVRDGYDEAILLDVEGYVAEGSGENIFVAYGRQLETPPIGNILEGITRDSVLRICEAEGLAVREARMSRDRVYCADEAFFTGTAAEITPIREVDHRQIGEGKPGPVTRELQAIFRRCVLGDDRRFESWLTFVE